MVLPSHRSQPKNLKFTQSKPNECALNELFTKDDDFSKSFDEEDDSDQVFEKLSLTLLGAGKPSSLELNFLFLKKN